MPLFGNRRRQHRETPTYIGRKFSSRAGVEESIANFRMAISQQLGSEPEFFTAEWTGPDPAPVTVIGAAPTTRREAASYLTLWADGGMYFVAPDYAVRPTPPLVGMWKMRDTSLTSTGSVEAGEFGVRGR
ncbi:hypothetical protein [Streptomyces tailanensis]|uniref:hypothetical protein n=1 Tax=Streptomyces tailanensis TaxID=2569858 RepID=UPI00122DC697|nr:hypothetical protein [Streptomyces tailanensis]